MQISLDQVRPGTWASVTQIRTPQALTARLQDFGLIPGTAVCCRYRSPGGHVTALELRGTVVAMRTRDMRDILVAV